MAGHRINLRGPWDFKWQGTRSLTGTSEPAGTVTMPKDWQVLFGDVPGTAEFRRAFHRPTNLEPHERVMLVFSEVRGAGRVRLNEFDVGQFVADGELTEFEITSLMHPFNELAVEIAFDPDATPGMAGGLFGVVALEIRTEDS